MIDPNGNLLIAKSDKDLVPCPQNVKPSWTGCRGYRNR